MEIGRVSILLRDNRYSKEVIESMAGTQELS